MKYNNQIIFGDKTLSSLLEDIYKTAEQNRVLLTTAINDLRDRLRSKNTSVEDISYVGNVITSLFDTTVKNDEHLIKLATVIQKLLMTEKQTKDDERVLLTEFEKQQLLSSAKEQMQKIKDDVDKTTSSALATSKKLLKEDSPN